LYCLPGERFAKPPLHGMAQRIDVHELLGRALVHAASTSSLTEGDPVSRSVAGTGEAIGLDKCFHQKWSSAILALEIAKQLADRVGKGFYSPIPEHEPRAGSGTGLFDTGLTVSFPLLVIPTDPAIACRHFPNRARPLQSGQNRFPGTFRVYQTTRVCADRDAIGKVNK